MKHFRYNRLRLSLQFSLIVFMILLVTSVIMSLLFILVERTGFITKIALHGIHIPILIFIVISLIIGTVVSFFMSRFPLKPIRRIIQATDTLAKGDFSTRLAIANPPELKALADSFNRMAQELGSIEVLRTDFINNFSHEFKTPIVSIKGFAEILKNDDITPTQRNEYLDIIISESTRLSALATHVLNLSKVENLTILTDQTRFNLTEQIRQCIVLLARQWEQKQQELSIELDEITYVGNRELLNQIWVNLIDNAVKFTPPKKRIAISLHADGDTVRFTIQNDGEGISPEAVRHVFDKFYQGEHSHTAEGNGLGLSVAQRVAQLHGGEITCQSAPGEGTAFVVRLPFANS